MPWREGDGAVGIGKRLAVMDVRIWTDDPDKPVLRTRTTAHTTRHTTRDT